MTYNELETFVLTLGSQKYRAKQLFEWLHIKKIRHFEECHNLPKQLLTALQLECELNALSIVERIEDSLDGTIKYLLQLHDQHVVEVVLMHYKYGYSLCISSQVGCRMGCTFCASTMNGLIRNLTASEMLDQIYTIERDINEPIHSVVVMGTGEPFDNYDNFIRFVQLISDPIGRNLSRRHITVSTCGIIPRIKQLIEDAPQINLAISLHATNQHARRNIMPISQKYDINELILACKQYADITKRRITFEYSLIKDVNDSPEQALELARILKGLLCHVNLIPVNPVDEKTQQPSSEESVKRFKGILDKNHIQTTLRRSLGQEIDAACGQLRNRYMDES